MEPRKRKRLLLAFAVIVASVAGFWLLLNRNPEPTYNGKPLSYWVQMYSRLDLGFGDEEQAAAAIRAIGTNALPFLLKWTDYKPTKLDEWRVRNYGRFPEWMTSHGPFQWSQQALKLSGNANNAFIALGPIAEPAIPELRSRLDDPDIHRTSLAFSSLMAIGPAAIPIAIETISNPGTNYHRYSDNLAFLHVLGTNHVVAVVPTVLKNLEHTNKEIAVSTAYGLGNFTAYGSEEFTSALTNGLLDPRVEVRRAILSTILLYGDEHTLPALTNALTDPDSQVRASAKSAIDVITSEN